MFNRSIVIYLLVGVVLFLAIDHQEAAIKVLNHYRNSARYVNQFAVRPNVEYRPKDFYRAGEYHSRLIKLLPNETLSYGALGYVYHKLGQTQRSISAYEKAVQYNPDLFGYQFNLGLLYYQEGRFDEALKVLKKALKTSPNPSIVHHKKIASQLFPKNFQGAWVNEKILQLKKSHAISQQIITWASVGKQSDDVDAVELYYYISEIETGVKPLQVIVKNNR